MLLCPSPRCAEWQEVAGCSSVSSCGNYDRCERCGGITVDGKRWYHRCANCKREVTAGELVGIFVPHRCIDCDEQIVAEERRAGKVCRTCNNVISYCTC